MCGSHDYIINEILLSFQLIWQSLKAMVCVKPEILHLVLFLHMVYKLHQIHVISMKMSRDQWWNSVVGTWDISSGPHFAPHLQIIFKLPDKYRNATDEILLSSKHIWQNGVYRTWDTKSDAHFVSGLEIVAMSREKLDSFFCRFNI